MAKKRNSPKMVPGGVPFAMLSDPGGEIGKVYGVYDEGAGVDIRGRFLIDPEVSIQAMEVMTPPVGRNFEELIRQIMAFSARPKRLVEGGREHQPVGGPENPRSNLGQS